MLHEQMLLGTRYQLTNFNQNYKSFIIYLSDTTVKQLTILYKTNVYPWRLIISGLNVMNHITSNNISLKFFIRITNN